MKRVILLFVSLAVMAFQLLFAQSFTVKGKGGCVKTLAQPHLYFKFCYIFFWLCYFFLMHLATSCYIPIISGYK